MASDYVDEIIVPEGTEDFGFAQIPRGVRRIGRLVLPGSVRLIDGVLFDHLAIGELVLPDGPCCILAEGLERLDPEIEQVTIPAGLLVLPCVDRFDEEYEEYVDDPMASLARAADYATKKDLPPDEVLEDGSCALLSFLSDIVEGRVDVDPAHPLLRSVDGVLYDKALETLLFVPHAMKKLTLPSSLRRVARHAVLYHHLTYIRLPEGTRVLETDAIYPTHAIGHLTLEIPWSLEKNDMFFHDMTVLFRTPYGSLTIDYGDLVYSVWSDPDSPIMFDDEMLLKPFFEPLDLEDDIEELDRSTRWSYQPFAVLHAETEETAWEAFHQLSYYCAIFTAPWCCDRWPESRRFRMYMRFCAPKLISYLILHHDTVRLRTVLDKATLTVGSLQILLSMAETYSDTAAMAILLDYAGEHGLFPNGHRL